jgi:O-antigen/teichoic acid export membrane protein
MEIIFIVVGVLFMILIGSQATWIARDWLTLNTLSISEVSNALIWMGIIIGIRWLVSLYRAALLGLDLQVWCSIENASYATLRGPGTLLALIYIAPTIQVFFIFNLILVVTEVWLLHLKLKASIVSPLKRPQFNLQSMKAIYHFAAGMTMITIFATLMTQVDRLLLSKLLSLKDFGYFTLAIAIASVVTILTVPIGNIVFPKLSSFIAKDNQKDLGDQYHFFSQILSSTLAPVCLIICVFSSTIIFVWTGDEDIAKATSHILSVWIIGSLLNGLTTMPYFLQLSYGAPKITILAYATSVMVSLPALIIFIPEHGAIAAAWVWLIVNLGYILFTIPVMHSKYLKNHMWKWYLQDTIIPVATAFACVIIVLLIEGNLGDDTRILKAMKIIFYATLIIIISFISTPIGRNIFNVIFKNKFVRNLK